MLGIHPAQQWASGAVKFAVIAPVAAGVTADPGWMSAFTRHVEACGFESIVAVEHTVLMTEYGSVYPYDASGRVELPADCPVPDPLDLLAFLAAQTDQLGLATGVLGLPSRAGARRAGRLGDGFQPLGVGGSELTELIEIMRDAAGRAGRDPDALELSLGHLVTKIDGERADRLAALGADRVVLAMPPAADLGEARDLLSACAQRLALTP